MQLTDQELATVLAALRYWQQAMHRHGGATDDHQIQWARGSMEHFDAEAGVLPLPSDGISALCERLNSPDPGYVLLDVNVDHSDLLLVQNVPNLRALLDEWDALDRTYVETGDDAHWLPISEFLASRGVPVSAPTVVAL